MNEEQLSAYIREILKEKKVKEGTCGYGIDGELGDEPAGPHLLKKVKESIKQSGTVNFEGEEYDIIKKDGDWVYLRSIHDTQIGRKEIKVKEKDITVNEGLSPETAAKADSIKKAMIGKNRDKLFSKYGKDAEKVAHGRAVDQAKKASEKKETVDEAGFQNLS